MSVTFSANIPNLETHEVPEPCLCAQMSDKFLAAMDGCWDDAVKDSLRDEANPECPFCHGTGVEVREVDNAPSLNLCNDNAQRLLGLLGIPFDWTGEIPVSEARRGVLRALNSSKASDYERPAETLYGPPRTREGGVVDLRPLRLCSPALTSNDLIERVRRFSDFVEEACHLGASRIYWG